MGSRYEAGTRVSEYILEQCVGAGTFGEVWQARHHVWKSEEVAIKLPTEPEYVRYLQREGVVVHGLRHPNIVRVLGFDPYSEVPYLVMELVRGPSLRHVLDDNPKGLPIDCAVVVVRGVLAAIAAAHESNIIHSDLKPGNVLLNLEGRPLEALTINDVKLSDFGLGVDSADTLRSLIVQSGSIERDEQSARVAGTLAYMAPEQRDSHQEATPRSDLYAVGVMLYEVLTGERPAGAELPSTLRAETPPPLDEVFRRLYARYDRRYESAGEALEDLAQRYQQSGRKLPGEASPRVPAVPPPVVENRPCPKCGKLVEGQDQFCIHCGHQLVSDVRRCRQCGGYPAPNDRYCIFCGVALTE